jgi:hypothetical protein
MRSGSVEDPWSRQTEFPLSPEEKKKRRDGIITLVIVGIVAVMLVTGIVLQAVKGKSGSGSATYSTSVTSILAVSNADLRVFYTVFDNGTSGTPSCTITAGDANSSYFGTENASPNSPVPSHGSEQQWVDVTITEQGAQLINQSQVSVDCS